MRYGKRLQEKHAELLDTFNVIQESQFEVRQQCLADRRFVSVPGAQWEGDLESNWSANKPRFEVNKIQRTINRIISEYRNQRIEGGFISKDGSDADQVADACMSLYRSDLQDSVADEAHDNAMDESVSGGMGAWQLITVMEDEDDPENENQRIAFDPIVDADTSVYFDLDAKRQDKADARLCYVLSSVARQSYIEAYDDDPVSWPKSAGQTFFDWATADVVYVATIYEVVKKGVTTHIYRLDATGEERDVSDEDMEDEELVMELDALGWRHVRDEQSKRKRVRKYLMSGGKILKDYGYIVGPNIPVVPLYGKRWFIDNVERFQGHVRLAKDAQRLANMERSKLAEIAAYSTVEKPIFTPEQVIGHELQWATDNINNFPYQLINKLINPDGSIAAVGPQSYTRVPQVPPAMAALLQITEKDLEDMTGERDSADEVKSNVSGKAVELVQNRLDMQAYIYISNMSKAIKREAQIWYGMAREVYADQGRKIRGLDKRGKPDTVEIKRPVVNDDDKTVYENDIAGSKLDVTVTVGPSSQSKRDATVRSLTSLMSVIDNPQDREILTAMILQNVEAEGIEDVNKFYRRKLVKMGVEKPTPEEEEELMKEAQAAAQQPPDAQTQYLIAGAKKEQALADKAQADTLLSEANADKARADAAKTVSDIKAQDIGLKLQVLDAVNASDEIDRSIQQPMGAQ